MEIATLGCCVRVKLGAAPADEAAENGGGQAATRPISQILSDIGKASAELERIERLKGELEAEYNEATADRWPKII